MSSSSTSVRVRCAEGLCPKSLTQAAVQLSPFGDIARLDVTLGPTSGCVLVTYFDVRAADEVLRQYGAYAEAFPPAAHDFRSITIPPSVIAVMPATFSGFQAYGEVQGVAMCGDEMVVDFYDMRSAQQVLMSLPGSCPKPQNYQMSVSQAEAALIKNRSAGFETAFAGGIDLPQQISSMMNQFGSLGLGLPDLSGMPGEPAKEAVVGDTTEGKQKGKPIRDKVNSKDLSKFEIMPAKIKKGEDPRTTVMFRNIPKSCSRESFVELLENEGLGERYTFFYMPFDKRRNIHCGFAFVNFKSPQDVLQLYESTQTSSWRSLTSGQNAMPPAVSYARLQGQEQLMRHFSLSAVMYDTDVQKRPQFLANAKAVADSTDEVEDAPAKVNVTTTSEKLSPQYISTTSMSTHPPGLEKGQDDACINSTKEIQSISVGA